MSALQFIDVPGYAAILFRRTYADLSLPGALMERARSWFEPTGATWLEKTKTWTFPSSATLTFGYMEHENDKYRYQSAEFQFVGFDELTQFSKGQFTFMHSRARRPSDVDSSRLLARVPVRVRGATNPGGLGHAWVKEYFIDSSHVRFIPARLGDNPFIDADTYRRDNLSKLSTLERQQMEDGSWIAAKGVMFERGWFTPHLLTNPPPRNQVVKRLRMWDLAATEPKKGKDPDYTVGALMSRLADGSTCIEDIRRIRATPSTVEKLVRSSAELDSYSTTVYIQEDPGQAGKSQLDHYRRRVLQGFTLKPFVPTGDKEVRARALSADSEAGLIHLVRADWNAEFLDEAEAFLLGSHDDQVDAASAGYIALNEGSASSYLQAMAPACPECGFPNRPHVKQCRRCDHSLLPEGDNEGVAS